MQSSSPHRSDMRRTAGAGERLARVYSFPLPEVKPLGNNLCLSSLVNEGSEIVFYMSEETFSLKLKIRN